MAVCLDNTATYMGCRNYINVRVLRKNANCFIAGCNWHLFHLAASKGTDAYSGTTGLEAEGYIVDAYYYFLKSTKRKKGAARVSGFC